MPEREKNMSSLYERYGGFAKINKIVMDFYDLLLDDDDVGAYFDDIDMPRLIDHQTHFISGILGGPITIDDNRLKISHARLGITDAHLDRMKSLLHQTLTSHDLDEADIQTVLGEIEIRRKFVVS